MSKIFQPFSIKDITFKNRLGMSPMCQYSAQDGFANDWHLVHYGTRAIGGIALVIVEATGVSPIARITPDDLGLWNDEQVEPLKRIVDFVHLQGSKAGIQIAHAGRKASHSSPFKGEKQLTLEEGGWETVAPSAVPFRSEEIPPHQLTKSEIKKWSINSKMLQRELYVQDLTYWKYMLLMVILFMNFFRPSATFEQTNMEVILTTEFVFYSKS
jgi:2,4-dienoyl-CoA reductase-like NADH-dependent reductase (Old Yellow Enzyme family)